MLGNAGLVRLSLVSDRFGLASMRLHRALGYELS